MRGATTVFTWQALNFPFQSTLLVRGATIGINNSSIDKKISIHAPRERSDCKSSGNRTKSKRFQSTLLVRGATCIYLKLNRKSVDFNPRSSWEERHIPPSYNKFNGHFNPRSSWEERRYCQLWHSIGGQFQSTLLVRGATKQGTMPLGKDIISIHAPRERSDAQHLYWPC